MNAVRGQNTFYILYQPIFLYMVLKEGSLGSSSLSAPKICLILKITVAHRYSFRLTAPINVAKSAAQDVQGTPHNSNLVGSLLINAQTPRGHTLESFKPLADQGDDERKYNTALSL